MSGKIMDAKLWYLHALTPYDLIFFKKPGKMGSIVIYYHANIMESDFELARQGLNKFVHPGHKGLSKDQIFGH